MSKRKEKKERVKKRWDLLQTEINNLLIRLFLSHLQNGKILLKVKSYESLRNTTSYLGMVENGR